MPIKYTAEQALAIMNKSGFTPLEPYVNSMQNWKCKCNACGTVSAPRFSQVANKGTRCRFCSSGKLKHEEAVEIMLRAGFSPIEEYISGSTPWLCVCTACGKESSPTLANVKNLKSGCKNCKRNQLEVVEVEARLNLQNLRLAGPYTSSRSLTHFHCLTCGTQFESTLQKLKTLTSPCPKCREVLRNEFIEDANALMNQVGLTPLEPYKNNHTPWKSLCDICGRTVQPQLQTLKAGHSGCRYCAGLQVDSGEAVQTMLNADLRPLEPFVSSKARWRCLCLKCGGETYTRYANISKGNGGCTPCGIAKRAKSKTFSQAAARQMMIDAGLEPLEGYVNQKTKWKCRCTTCGNTVEPMLNTIRNGDGGCKYCGKNYVDPDSAARFMEEQGFTVLVDYPGASHGWLSIHKDCGREVAPQYSSIKAGGGCKFCTNKGFQFHLPGYFYLITNESLRAHKIGISTSGIKQDRIESHVKHGWVLYRRMHFSLGNDAFLLEQATLKWLRQRLGLTGVVSPQEMPQGGWTETFSSDDIDLASVWKQVLTLKNEIPTSQD